MIAISVQTIGVDNEGMPAVAFKDGTAPVPPSFAQLSPREREMLQRHRMGRAVCALSLRATQQRLDASIETSMELWNLYHEAILLCAPDDDDSFELAEEKRQKLEHYEKLYLEDGVRADEMIKRVNWELAEGRRQGLLPRARLSAPAGDQSA